MAIINGVGRVGIRNYVSPIPQASTLINGLIHAWNANGNANDSIGGLNGTLTNGALATGDPKLGSGSFSFDGINDVVDFPNNSWNLAGDFSVSFWMNPSNNGSYRMMVENFNYTGLFFGWYISHVGSSILFDIFNGTGDTASRLMTPGYSIQTGQWQHITLVRKAGVGSSIYINGVLSAQNTSVINPVYHPTVNYSKLGAETISGGANYYLYNGLMDGVSIWNRALTSAEITELYGLTTELQAPTPTYPTSLKLFIDAGNALSYSGTGTTVTDLTGTQNGTLTNGTSYSSANGGSFIFDGINDYIDFGINTTIQPVTTATYNMWLNFSGPGTPWSFSNDGTGTNGGIRTWLDAGGLRFLLASSSTYQYYTTYSNNGSLIQYNNWYYLTLSIDGSTIKTYVNGVLQRTIAQTTIPTNGVKPLRIGQMNGDNWPMNGKISQMKIYNVQRSDAEVLTDYNEFKSRYGY